MLIRHSRRALALLALAPLAAGCAVQSGGASEGPTAQASEAISYAPLGFARVHSDGSVGDAYDSASTSPVTTSHVSGSGHYTVRFPALANGYNGHAQVTAEGTGNERCRITSWSPSSTTEQVDVQCNRPDGSNADAAFAVTYYRYAQPSTTSTYPIAIAYAWVNAGTAPSGYNFNPSGHLNTVSHTGTGTYSVRFPQAAYSNASIMITAYGGTGAPFCQNMGWSSSTDTYVNVKCWNASGAAADSDFAISYAASGPTLDQQSAHAWFSGGVSSSYSSVMPQYECGAATISGSVSSNVASVVVSGQLASWDASPLRRASFVNGYGWSTPIYCKASALSSTITSTTTSTSTTGVRCFDAAGNLTTPVFTFTQITSDASGPC